jgi:multiple sugar transport system permease protein
MTQTRRNYLVFLVLVAPVLLLRLLTAAYPIIQTIHLSTTNLHLIKHTNSFVGLDNYRLLLKDPNFLTAFGFTMAFVIFSTVLQLGVGLLIALLLNAKFRGRFTARTINLIPWAVPTIAAAFAFRWILDDQFGMFAHWIYQLFGIRPAFLNSALGARTCLILVNVWKNAPFMGLIFLAGLQGVPEEMYEAANVDGANAWKRFIHVTLPMVAPLLITMSMYFIVWQLASFDLIYGLTRGGPGVSTTVLGFQIFQEGLLFFKFGYASAISVVLMVLVALVGMAGVLTFRRFDYQ